MNNEYSNLKQTLKSTQDQIIMKNTKEKEVQEFKKGQDTSNNYIIEDDLEYNDLEIEKLSLEIKENKFENINLYRNYNSKFGLVVTCIKKYLYFKQNIESINKEYSSLKMKREGTCINIEDELINLPWTTYVCKKFIITFNQFLKKVMFLLHSMAIEYQCRVRFNSFVLTNEMDNTTKIIDLNGKESKKFLESLFDEVNNYILKINVKNEAIARKAKKHIEFDKKSISDIKE